MDTTQRTLLSLLANAIFDKPLSLPKNIDWQAVYRESNEQTVSMLALSAAPVEAVPPDIMKKWKQQTEAGMLSSTRVLYDHAKLHKLLTANGIPYVILKGNVSASYYPDPYFRSMGDVDFLIDKQNVQTADKLLTDVGFARCKSMHECETAYRKGSSYTELHWRVNGVPLGEAGERVNKYLSSIITDAEYSDEFGGYMKPTDFHHGLVMLLHIARHMTTGGIGLRHLCDWAVFADKIGNDFDDIFKDKLSEIGLYRFADILSQMSVVYLGMKRYNRIDAVDAKLISDLKDDMFASGNFGHKDVRRGDEAKFITSRAKGTVNDDSTLKLSILSANEIVNRHWHFAKKFPPVYPVGWAYFGTRYFLRSLMGKREKLDISGLMARAEKRKALYKQLKLFEKEI